MAEILFFKNAGNAQSLVPNLTNRGHRVTIETNPGEIILKIKDSRFSDPKYQILILDLANPHERDFATRLLQFALKGPHNLKVLILANKNSIEKWGRYFPGAKCPEFSGTASEIIGPITIEQLDAEVRKLAGEAGTPETGTRSAKDNRPTTM